MGSLRLSTVVAATVFVCVSILLISPTEVEGKRCENMRVGVCEWWLFDSKSEEHCKEKCQKIKQRGRYEYYDGFCRSAWGMFHGGCHCCIREIVSPPAIESM